MHNAGLTHVNCTSQSQYLDTLRSEETQILQAIHGRVCQKAFGATDPLFCCSRYTKYEASDYFSSVLLSGDYHACQFGTLLILRCLPQ